MTRTSRKADSVLRDRIQLTPGTVVLVVRDHADLKPLFGFVVKAMLDNGSIWYKVKLLEHPKPQKFEAKQVFEVVKWEVSPDEESRLFFVKRQDPSRPSQESLAAD